MFVEGINNLPSSFHCPPATHVGPWFDIHTNDFAGAFLNMNFVGIRLGAATSPNSYSKQQHTLDSYSVE